MSPVPWGLRQMSSKLRFLKDQVEKIGGDSDGSNGVEILWKVVEKLVFMYKKWVAMFERRNLKA